MQTGQTVTGNIGATDPEGDALTYTVTQGPQHGTLTIDQATGNFTYTPDDINYDAAQTDSFTVSVTDGKTNLLSLFGCRTATQKNIGLEVLNPTVERVIVNMPAGITKPVNPRFSEDGKSILFAGTPAAGGRTEIYQINIDGTDAEVPDLRPVIHLWGRTRQICSEAGSLLRRFRASRGAPQQSRQPPRYAILETAGYNGNGSWSPSSRPTAAEPGNSPIDPQREMRLSPDGTHVLFTRIVFGPEPVTSRPFRSWAS